MQSASELNALPSERCAGDCQPPFRHGACEAGRSAPPWAAYEVHSSSLEKLFPLDVTSVCQPFFWHFLAAVELPASAVALAPSAASKTPATRAVILVRVIWSVSLVVGWRREPGSGPGEPEGHEPP